MSFEVYKRIKDGSHNLANEEELRILWIRALSDYLQIDFQAERNKLDSSYNNVIIEFKSKGKFNGRKTSTAFKEAMNGRLKPYILKKAEKDGCESSDYIGIAIDGDSICFAQVINGEITHGPILPFSEKSVSMVVTACRDSFRRAVTADNIIEDFGHNSIIGIELMQQLSNALVSNLKSGSSNKVKMLFEEWRQLYGQVADLPVSQVRSIEDLLQFEIDIESSLVFPASLFVVHTYNSLLIKLFAAEIISNYGLTSYKYFAQVASTNTKDELYFKLKKDIEMGEYFSQARILGFVEEAIFSWYLDVESEEEKAKILDAIQNILIKLSLYRTENLTDIRSTDVMKNVYQNLVPETLRKSLGEFYTPDWLVHFTIDKIDKNTLLNGRILDPTCGSGTFLMDVLRRKRTLFDTLNLKPREIIDKLINSVWGFDLNPLAVQSARINYLIAIVDLLKDCPGKEIEIPILLADAVYSPSTAIDSDETVVKYKIGSSVADLEVLIPTDIAFDRKKLDDVFNIMNDNIEKQEEFEKVSQIIEQKYAPLEGKNNWIEALKVTYTRVLNLHKRNWDGIWFRIIKNFFWSSTAGMFDVIVGNPPWVRWSKLPELYRERVKPTASKYSIFSNTPHHGGNELDISGLITYTVADKWLKGNGMLFFLLPQIHFQAPSSSGFRDFRINPIYNLNPISVDDFKALKPFQDVTNKTVLAIFKKTTKLTVEYPVSYTVWSAKEGQKKSIPPSYSLEMVMDVIESSHQEANPVTNENSPWSISPIGIFKDFEKIMGESASYKGRKGITADLNGIYFVDIVQYSYSEKLIKISTRPEAGKTDIGPKQEFWVEPDFLYPIIKGAGDFSTCYFNPNHSLYGMIPNKGITKEYYESVEKEIQSLELTQQYFSKFKGLLENRSTYRLRMKSAPYYSVYNIGQYTFSPWKVIWAEQKDFCAAVAGVKETELLGVRPYIPDHKIYFVDCYNKQEAYYLCGILNSKLVKQYVKSHNISIQIGNIFKHMNLPIYNERNDKHVQLSSLVELAHSEHVASERQKIINQVEILSEIILSEL